MMEQSRDVLRVFVSSTFADMQEERDELMLRVFPALRKLCEVRGALWEEIDLRWGVTAEQIEEGRLLPICLAEVADAWPFFIGVLGSRYGSRVGRIPEDIAAAEPWLTGLGNASVTEVEIRRALRGTARPVTRYFYFKGNEAGGADDRDARSLLRLKTELIETGETVRRYESASELGQLVLGDLAAAIERIVPAGGYADGFDEEARQQDDFAGALLASFVSDARVLAQLDRGVFGGVAPVVVTGPPGAGKSALLAAYASRVGREVRPASAIRRWTQRLTGGGSGSAFTIIHHAEATARSGRWPTIAQRVIDRVALLSGVAEPPALDVEQLRQQFVNSFHRVPASRTVLIVLDGLDHIDDEAAVPLSWLPETLPRDVRLLVSAAPGRVLDETRRRGWSHFALAPLSEEQRVAVIERRLAGMHRSLPPAAIERIAASPAAASPSALTMILEELRVFGDFAGLDVLIGALASAVSVEELYAEMLQRLTRTYDGEVEGLVRTVVSLLAVASGGLAAPEILDAVERRHGVRPLPLTWSRLRLALSPLILRNGGVLRLRRGEIGRSIESQFDFARTGPALRRILVDTLLQTPAPARRDEEILQQLLALGDVRGLMALLGDLTALERLWSSNRSAVMRAWRAVERETGHRATAAYTTANPSLAASELLAQLGYPMPAATIARALVDDSKSDPDPARAQHSLARIAVVLEQSGDLAGARRALTAQERMCRTTGESAGLATAIGNRGVLFVRDELLDEAAACFDDEARLTASLAAPGPRAVTAGHLGLLAHRRGDVAGALRFFRQQERLAREAGDARELAESFGQQGVALAAKGKLRRALELHRIEERLWRDLHDERGLGRCLGNLALLLMRIADFDAADRVLNERAALYERIGEVAGGADTLLQRAVLYGDRLGLWSEAVPLAKQALTIAVEHDLPRVRQAAAQILASRRQTS